jgi:hypothetical protein
MSLTAFHAAPRHVAICDRNARNLSHANTACSMQYISATKANRRRASASEIGTQLAVQNITSGPRRRRGQQGRTQNSRPPFADLNIMKTQKPQGDSNDA